MATKKSNRRVVIVDVPGTAGPVTPPPAEPARVIPIAVAGNSPPGFFTRVKSNVKQASMDVPLGACTAITTARNRAGKTAVLDAFRLALTGKHPIGAHAADLAGLTPDGAYPWARLEGATGSTFYRFESGKKTPEMTLSGEMSAYHPDTLLQLLPLVSMGDLLSLGTAKAREALFKRFGEEAVKSATMPAALTPEQQALWTRSVNAMGANVGSVVDRLTLAGSWLRSHKRALGDQSRALENEKQKLHEAQSASGVGAPSPDLFVGVQAKIDAYKKLDASNTMQQRMKTSTDRLSNLIAQAQALPPAMSEEELAAAKQATHATWNVELITAEVAEQQRSVMAFKNGMQVYSLTLELRKLMESNVCIACERPAPEAAEVRRLVEGASRTVAEYQAALAKVESRLLEATQAQRTAVKGRDDELHALQSAYDADMKRRADLGRDLNIAKAAYEGGQEQLQAAGLLIEKPKETLAELEAQLAALNAAKTEADRGTQLGVEIRKLHIEVEDVKVVEKAVGEGLASIVTLVKKDAEAAVNAWMPPGFVAALMLDDEEGKPACRWEIIGADGKPHPRGAMSGAEWSALTVAIACAWSEGQKHRFLLLDDADLAGFSAENVRAALATVAKAVAEGRLTQALVAWSRPEEIPSTGWSVVSL